MTDLFTRYGKPHTGAVSQDPKGRPYFMQARPCSRCGGAGGTEKWPGWTCYDCGGSGKHVKGPETVRLYTADEVAKLEAGRAKRTAKKQAANDAWAAARKAEADTRREDFVAIYGELLAAAEPYMERSSFVRDVVTKAREQARLSERQEEVLRDTIAKMATQDTQRAASGHVGSPGQRIEVAVTVDRVASFDRPGFRTGRLETVWIVTMRDAASNAIVSKSVNFRADKGEQFVLRATVKEHGDYRGEKQTVVQRCAAKKIAAFAA